MVDVMPVGHSRDRHCDDPFAPASGQHNVEKTPPPKRPAIPRSFSGGFLHTNRLSFRRVTSTTFIGESCRYFPRPPKWSRHTRNVIHPTTVSSSLPSERRAFSANHRVPPESHGRPTWSTLAPRVRRFLPATDRAGAVIRWMQPERFLHGCIVCLS